MSMEAAPGVVAPDATPTPAPSPQEAAVMAADVLRGRLITDKAWGRAHLDGDVEKQNQLRALDTLRVAPPEDPAALAELKRRAGIEDALPPAPLPAPPSPYFSATAKPSDYQPVYSNDVRSLPTFADIDKGTKEFAAAMQFPPALGKAVIEHIADLSPRVAFKMSEDERGRWLIEQTSMGMMRAGGPGAYEATKADARKALLDIGKASPWAKVIADGAVMNDWWLIQTLARHWRAHPRGGAGRST